MSKPGNTILVNPNFIPKDKKAERKASKVVDDDPKDEDLEKMNEELKELERQRIELEKQAMKKRIEKLKRDNAEVSFLSWRIILCAVPIFSMTFAEIQRIGKWRF